MKICKQLAELSRVLYADLDTPVSLGCFLRFKYGEWDQLVSMTADPRNYPDNSTGTDKFRRDYQAVELLRKCDGLPTTIDTKAVALASFWDAEKQCAQTNFRLAPFVFNFGQSRADMRVFDSFVTPVKKLIARWLGPLPDELQWRFGPGATYESKGHPFASSLTVADKMSMDIHCTSDAADLARWAIWPSAWGRGACEDGLVFKYVRGNRFTTVRKDATKERGICIEPGANVALQLGVGRHIRTRLKRFGLDLKRGQLLHSILAMSGSLSGDIATIDLSSASDTVAYLLVKLLLPEEWFELLDSLRSPYTLIGKGKEARWCRLEKFSSMGNGFTFELETLLFAAIAMICCPGEVLGSGVTVYGDDIIVPTQYSNDVVSALKYFGFTPNRRKTYTSGPFRESCGGEFFLGTDVTPYRIKEIPNEPSQWVGVVNGLRQRGAGWSRSNRARRRALGFIPHPIRRLRGPVAFGDLVIHDDDVESWTTVVRSQIRYVKVYRPILRRISLDRWSPAIQLATALYGTAEGIQTNALARSIAASNGDPIPGIVVRGAYLTPRNGVSGHRMGWAAFS